MAKVHECMLKAMEDIAKTGIYKTSKATMGGTTVAYRGIEAAMNEMSGVLIRAGLTVAAEYAGLDITDRQRGAVEDCKYTRIVTLRGRFTFSADDGSSVAFTCYGEAADSMDKAVTKAQSVAFRTALFQAFVVPYMAIDPEADETIEAEDEFAAVYNGVKSQQTDAEALTYYKKNVGLFKPNTPEYTKFRRLVEERRRELAGKQ